MWIATSGSPGWSRHDPGRAEPRHDPAGRGIETEAEYIFLRSNGCRLAQGFWFAHPMPPSELGKLVRAGKSLGQLTVA
jgi:predicted signal transduction protein with EAL and GGDEF domain